MDNKIMSLYKDFMDGLFNRREFLNKLTVIAGSVSSTCILLSLLEDNNAQGQVISENDSRLMSEYIQYPAETGEMRAYFSQPKGNEKLPGVIVIHENRGLNPHIEDVARRVALEGFMAIAPDALSPQGGTPKDTNEARSLFQKLDMQSTVKNFVAAVQYLKTHPQSTGKVGVMGFCWGGGLTNQVAVNAPDVSAAVPFYGAQPAVEDVAKIKASMLIHYAGMDERINAGIAAFEAALKKSKIDYTIYMYEGAGHAFFNDTNPSRYHKDAAQLAWKRTIEFFNVKLKT
ncbi:dienelactone hydrolase family protein [Candidatus Latescibacterota bacterium]